MNIKNSVTISLITFLLATVIILSVALVFNQNKTSVPLSSSSQNTVAQNPATSNNTTTTSSSAGYTASQVASHNSSSSCWIIISNKVYDVTNLIAVHTGGAGAILANCGKDGTVAFDTKDGQGSHSGRAQNILSTYFIGNLK